MIYKKVPLERTLFIDPGLEGTGWAFFVEKRPVEWGVFRSKHELWQAAALDISGQVNYKFQHLSAIHLGLEFPEHWEGSARSAASQAKGDLLRLAFLCGAMYQNVLCYNWHFYSVQQWKGQLPKDVVIRRIQKTWGIRPPNHAADAVGMGLAAQGLL